MKCDEEKPSCFQCCKTGRVCDSYEATPSRTHSKFDSASYISPYQKAPAFYRIIPRFSNDETEARGFDFFRSSIGPILFQAFNLTFVDRIIMQLSHSDDTIKHAVIALGSLGEQFAKHRSLSPKILDRGKRLQFARLQNSKAIQHLRRQLSDSEQQSVELALISCFLFVIFDFLLGDEVSSYVHLRAGLNILRGYYKMQEGLPISTDQAVFLGKDLLVNDFARIFSVLDLHAAIWLGLASCQSPPLIEMINGVTTGELVKVFKTLGDAADSLHYQLMRIHMFRHSLAAYDCERDTMGMYKEVKAGSFGLLDMIIEAQ